MQRAVGMERMDNTGSHWPVPSLETGSGTVLNDNPRPRHSDIETTTKTTDTKLNPIWVVWIGNPIATTRTATDITSVAVPISGLLLGSGLLRVLLDPGVTQAVITIQVRVTRTGIAS